MESATQRTLKALRGRGRPTQIVEKWNPFAKVRQDLFGMFDVLTLTEEGILGIQVSTMAHRGERKEKILASPHIKPWLESGGVAELWSWRKIKNRWKAKVDRFELNGEVRCVEKGEF